MAGRELYRNTTHADRPGKNKADGLQPMMQQRMGGQQVSPWLRYSDRTYTSRVMLATGEGGRPRKHSLHGMALPSTVHGLAVCRRAIGGKVELRGGGVCVQGMSDLLAPVLLVTQDEVDAFWLFEALMRRVGGNFLLWSGLGSGGVSDATAEKTCCQLQLDGAPLRIPRPQAAGVRPSQHRAGGRRLCSAEPSD